ncbi:uncharacterized protein LOC122404211 [Colletes gigas]|uniref:uncharacterized protein LOC122404211 n=1 Tax=Colletes gigas TaxID=935657 RepID=UPI001C9B5466|nr:uncharacterized protein LOC122404211 [Colletes gigas]
MDSELKTLIAERGILKASLTRLKRFFTESAGVTPIGALQKRLDANVGLYDNFNKIQNRIELLVSGTDLEGAHEAFRKKFEETYFKLIAEIESHILASRSSQRQQPSASPAVTDGSNQVHVKLPTIQIPHFDGKYNDWIKFRDTFMSLIHENESLSGLQKYHYLNSVLQGSAARVIEALGISEANYRVAWDALVTRYQDSTALLRHHVHALLDIAPVKKFSASALRDFLDDAKNHLLALKSLGEPVEKWDKLIVPLLSRKLDVVSAREWEKRVISAENITFNHFADFLEERSKYLENTTTPAQYVAGGAEKQLFYNCNNQLIGPIGALDA